MLYNRCVVIPARGAIAMVRMAGPEDVNKPMTAEEQEQALAALERARIHREELLRWNGGRLFTPTSGELIAEIRSEQDDELP
jgi:hypothetical protein